MMKRLLLICYLLLWCTGASAVQSAGSLTCDTAKIRKYQADANYDYNSQLTIDNKDWLDSFIVWLSRKMPNFIHTEQDIRNIHYFLILLFVIIVLAAICFFYKKHPKFFVREPKKNKLAYNELEENIYEVDFDKEIANCLRSNDFKLAIRMVYMQTLRFLNDHERINWQPYKTPTEYIYEIKERRTAFQRLTNHFLRIRYGNFDADRILFDTVISLQKAVEKGGADEK